MSEVAIRVENRSKLYRLGAREKGYKTFREAVADLAAADFELTVSSFQLTVPTQPSSAGGSACGAQSREQGAQSTE